MSNEPMNGFEALDTGKVESTKLYTKEDWIKAIDDLGIMFRTGRHPMSPKILDEKQKGTRPEE